MPLLNGIPNGEWVAASSEPVIFPNLMVPYEEESTEKGPRIRFGLNILYLNEVESLDPARVRGLVIPETTHAERRQEDAAANRGRDSIGQ
jgi:hypothetical protein